MLTSFMVGFFVSLFATDQSIASVQGATIVRCGSEPYVWRPVKGKVAPLPRAAPRAACPRPFSRFFALAVWAGGLLTTVIRPQPCGLVSLRMGITQYSEVSAEYASLLVENVDSSVPLGSYFPCAECLYF